MICRADAVVRMLHLNAPPAANGRSAAAPASEEEYYKVLVLDAFTKDVLAPLLRVNDLRRHGITLHLLLEVPPACQHAMLSSALHRVIDCTCPTSPH